MKIIVLAVVTIDGKLARNQSHLSDWSSHEDKKIFVSATRHAGVIIMGNNTYKTLTVPLPGRLHIVLTRDPEGKQNIPGVAEFTDQSPEQIAAELEARGFTEAVLGGGSQVNSLFLQSGLVDEIWLTIEPVIFGQGVDLLSSPPLDLRAKLIYMEKLNEGGTVHLRYSLR